MNLAGTIELLGERRLIEVILSDPRDADIDALNHGILEEAVRVATTAVEANPYLVRFVYSYSREDGLRARFAVAANGAPVLIELQPSAEPGVRYLSLGGSAPDTNER